MNKRTGRLCFLILCLAAVLGSGSGSKMVSAASEMEKMRVIKVGYFAFNGYHEEDSEGIKSGYGYDFLQYMARYANVTYEYVGYGDSWEDMQQMLENGEIDLVTSARKTKKRFKKFAFSDEDIGYSSAILTVKSDNDNIRAGEYKTYDGMRVAMLRGNSRNTEFERFAGKHGFRYRPVYYETAEGVHLALMEGVVNAALTSDLRMTRNEKCLESFGESPFYVITRKEDTDLMDLVNDAVNQMDLKQTGWRQELRRKYYASSGSVSRYLTSDEKKYIRGLSKENRSQGGQNPWMIGLAVESIVLLILCVILFLRSYGMAFAYRKRLKNTRKGRETYGNDKHDNG